MSKNLKRIILFIIIATGISLSFIYREQINPAGIQSWIESAGHAAPVLFICIYILSTILFLPGSLLTLLGGALFGPVWGTLYNLTGATAGAMISFLISRYLASGWIEKKAAGKTQQLIKGVESEGWRFVAFTRLVPIFPFNLLNYALGLTKISFSQYSFASFIFMFPGALAYTYIGYIGKEAATGGEDLIKKAMLAIALLAVVIFIPRIINKIRKVNMLSIEDLKSHIDNKMEILLLDVRKSADFNGEQGHIKQAKLIPLEELPQRITELESAKNKHIITICRTDKRSSEAAKILSNLGFENVQVARMGMTDWNKHNYPLATSNNTSE
ncbi:MAG: sulfurtransferase [endosymbiont of Galathealinum brachiosum]|uniref:TVP38/TMEM64 family membrane protein n=1 Tax=endosymbiont of Galathealinum brachiosum TaxID=2200906 RepID=A0A370DE29_9GAMM|nr:MAG: sulfurtransferase [endosymbiont of Galathealinum brachiosum]